MGINIREKVQYKLQSQVMRHSKAPCFINGDSEQIVIGGWKHFEIWDIATRSSLRVIKDFSTDSAWAMCSVNNILAVGSNDKKLYLYDVRNWEMIYSKGYLIKYLALQ